MVGGKFQTTQLTCKTYIAFYDTLNVLYNIISGLYKVSYSGGGGVYQFCWGRISSCEEGKRISKLWGRIRHESNIILILKLLGRISSGEGGLKILEENQDL